MNNDTSTTQSKFASELFQAFRDRVESGDSSLALENLAKTLLDKKHFHELFEVRKMQLRESLNLPLRSTESTAELPVQQKEIYEKGLIKACEEIGTLLVHENRLREAWVYLQAVDDQSKVQQLLMSVEINDENADDLIGLAINEGIEPVQGFEWILDRLGTCNAITTYDSFFFMFTPTIRKAAAEKLTLHLHKELKTNLLNQIRQQQPDKTSDFSIAELIDQHPWVFGGGMRHIDESHLASVVRIGRIAENSEAIKAAIDLAKYGETMPSDYSATGDTPFENLYEDSRIFFEALDGIKIDSTTDAFRKRADACNINEETSAAVEWYLYLLHQLGESQLALTETLRLLPVGISQMNISPSLYELANSRADWDLIEEFFQQNERLLDFSVAVLESRRNFSGNQSPGN